MPIESNPLTRENPLSTQSSKLHRFFFYPFEEKTRRLAAVIAHIALTILTGFIWQIPFWMVRQMDKRKIEEISPASGNDTQKELPLKKENKSSIVTPLSPANIFAGSDKSRKNWSVEEAVRNWPEIQVLLSSPKLPEKNRVLLEDAIEFYLKGECGYEKKSKWFRSEDLLDYANSLIPEEDSEIYWATQLSCELACNNGNGLRETLEFCLVDPNRPNCTKFPFIGTPSNNHFVLIFVDYDLKTIEYYDSMVKYGNHEQIVKNLQMTAKSLDFNVEIKVTKLLQHDGYECGAWFAYFLEKRLENAHFDPNSIIESEVNIMDYRVKIIANLILDRYSTKARLAGLSA